VPAPSGTDWQTARVPQNPLKYLSRVKKGPSTWRGSPPFFPRGLLGNRTKKLREDRFLLPEGTNLESKFVSFAARGDDWDDLKGALKRAGLEVGPCSGEVP
jgi:hypothetical protein